MIRYRLTTPSGSVEVYVDSDDPDVANLIEYQGPPPAVSHVRHWVERSYGICGHFVADQTTPKDLAHAMKSPRLSRFEPRCVSGAEIVANHSFAVKPGEVT